MGQGKFSDCIPHLAHGLPGKQRTLTLRFFWASKTLWASFELRASCFRFRTIGILGFRVAFFIRVSWLSRLRSFWASSLEFRLGMFCFKTSWSVGCMCDLTRQDLDHSLQAQSPRIKRRRSKPAETCLAALTVSYCRLPRPFFNCLCAQDLSSAHHSPRLHVEKACDT